MDAATSELDLLLVPLLLLSAELVLFPQTLHQWYLPLVPSSLPTVFRFKG